jgi:hypothetical protein
MRGNRTRKGAGAGPPHEHHHVPCACCNHVHAVHAGCCRREGRGGVGCGVWAGKGAEGESVLRMMMMRTTDGQPWLAGQSKANQSKQHRGKAAQWGRHKDRVHTRLAGHREGGREFKNKRFTVVALAQETSRRQRQDAVLEGGTSMRRRTEKAISMNTRNRRISRLTFSGGSA